MNTSVNRTSVNTTSLSPEEIKAISAKLESKLRTYGKWESRFKFAYFACLILSLLASAASGLLIKLDAFKGEKHINDLVAVLAATAALLQLLNTSAGFNARHIANRKARSAIQALQLDWEKGDLPKDQTLDRIKEIHNQQSKLE